MAKIRPRERAAIIQSLRAGVTPRVGLEHIQVGRVNEVKAMIEEQGLPLPHRDMVPETLEEKLITYADTFYTKSHLTQERTPEEARRKLAQFGEIPVRRFDEWSKLFE